MSPYTVDWAGVDTNAMPAGIYIITINDNFNCGPIEDTVNISHPDEFLIDILSNRGGVPVFNLPIENFKDSIFFARFIDDLSPTLPAG